MSEQECRYPCGCEQFFEEHCACMDGHRRCSRCWAPWHLGSPCICEKDGCAAAGVGLGDVDGNQFWLCDDHRYPVPGAGANDASVEVLVNAVLNEARGYRIDRAILTVALSRALPDALREASR